MQKRWQLGLIVGGNSTGSAILRLPKLVEELGPVMATSHRVARRLSNTMHGGYPVSEYQEFQAARLVLIRVPDAMLPRLIDELCESELVMKDTSFALCESWLSIDILEPLRARGASVASVLAVPTLNRDSFIVQGQTSAVRQVRRFLEQNDARAWEIAEESKALYFAAELLATALALPLFVTAQQALRAAGVSGNPLIAIIEEMGQKTLQDFVKGARLSWGGPLTECSPETANEHFENLRENYPELATTLDEQLAWARERMSRMHVRNGREECPA